MGNRRKRWMYSERENELETKRVYEREGRGYYRSDEVTV